MGVGIDVARDLVAAGNRCLLTGDMGIANTTASAALICAFTGRDASEVTGRGTGVDTATLARKIDVVRRGLALNHPDPADPVRTLAAVGGLEHAAIAGFIMAGAALGVPVILDGVIAGSAALAACAIAPGAASCLIAGHRSAEPGHTVALEHLGLRPLVDLDLRLGEGTAGAAGRGHFRLGGRYRKVAFWTRTYTRLLGIIVVLCGVFGAALAMLAGCVAGAGRQDLAVHWFILEHYSR
jgi:nicotinate-nucleotide--dimethylbenzimidazole phosphoribosyltransferase